MKHESFFTVDLMNPTNPGKGVKQSCYKRMCALAAQFVDENSIALSFPETGQMRTYNNDLARALQSNNPLKAVVQSENVPVIMVEEEDPRLHAAAEEARSRWPEFVRVFRDRQNGQLFSVKIPFRDGEDVEWMWVEVSDITAEAVGGHLANAPVSLHNIREGDYVNVPISIVADWIHSKGKRVLGGGFSVKALGGR